MKHLIAILLLIAISLMLTSCTMQFKGEKIEMEGHVDKIYTFEGFTWTEPRAELHDSTD